MSNPPTRRLQDAARQYEAEVEAGVAERFRELYDDLGVASDNGCEQDTRSDAPSSRALSKRSEPTVLSPPSSPSEKRRSTATTAEQQRQLDSSPRAAANAESAIERLSALLCDIHAVEARLAANEGEIEKAKDSLAELVSSRVENGRAFEAEREERIALNFELGLLDTREQRIEKEMGSLVERHDRVKDELASLVKRKEKIGDDNDSLLEAAEAEAQGDLRKHKAWMEQAAAERWQAEERLWQAGACLDAAQTRGRQWEKDDAQDLWEEADRSARKESLDAANEG